jgi:hypothetical protein
VSDRSWRTIPWKEPWLETKEDERRGREKGDTGRKERQNQTLYVGQDKNINSTSGERRHQRILIMRTTVMIMCELLYNAIQTFA